MHSNSVFHALMKALPRWQFERLAERAAPGERTVALGRWTHLQAMLYGQIGGFESLRTLVGALGEQYASRYHLGMDEVKRSTLSHANRHRSVKVFEAVLTHLIGMAGGMGEAREVLRILDSSPLHLDPKRFGAFSQSNGRCQGAKLHLEYDANGQHPVFFDITPANVNDIKIVDQLTLVAQATYVFDRGYMKFAWWQTLHDKGCRFVSRMQRSVACAVTEQRPVLGENILADEVITLTGRKAKTAFHQPLRRVRVTLDDQRKYIDILSNDLTAPASEIANLYRRRWEIEVLFKWIKQRLRIKKFIGTCENAVKIQIITALIAWLLVRLYHHRSSNTASLSDLLLLIRLDPFRKLDHRHAFERRRCRSQLLQYLPKIPNLFAQNAR